MPRPLRVELAGGVYHINAGATHGGRIFHDDADRARWLQLLGIVVRECSWECLMYCLLSTHFHLVVRIEVPTMARGMQYLNARHAESFNNRYGRRGHAFGARYHSELVETAAHALEVTRYCRSTRSAQAWRRAQRSGHGAASRRPLERTAARAG